MSFLDYFGTKENLKACNFLCLFLAAMMMMKMVCNFKRLCVLETTE